MIKDIFSIISIIGYILNGLLMYYFSRKIGNAKKTSILYAIVALIPILGNFVFIALVLSDWPILIKNQINKPKMEEEMKQETSQVQLKECKNCKNYNSPKAKECIICGTILE